jgi:hypothetical protein
MTKRQIKSVYFAAAELVVILLLAVVRLHASSQLQVLPPSAAQPPTHQPASDPAAVSGASTPVEPQATTIHSITNPSATPSTIVVNTLTPVTVTVSITDPALVPGSVNLLRLEATGAPPTILGVMQNAGGSNYILQTTLDEAATGQVQLEVSAAFRGSLKRVLSDQLTIPIFNAHTDTTVGVSVQFPPGLSVVTPPSGAGQEFLLQSTPGYIGLGETFNTSDPNQEPSAGYVISISSNSYTLQPFDLPTYVATALPGYDVATTTQITVSGLDAYALTFNDANAPKPLIIIPHGTTVYEVSYNSTFDPGTPGEVTGLTTFATVLQHLQFLR